MRNRCGPACAISETNAAVKAPANYTKTSHFAYGLQRIGNGLDDVEHVKIVSKKYKITDYTRICAIT